MRAMKMTERPSQAIPFISFMFFMVVVLLSLPSICTAATCTWDAGGDTTNWFDALNWSGDAVPLSGDSVTVSNSASLLLTNSTPTLSSFTITNATLTFTNWTTVLTATNVTIQSDGTLSHVACITNVVESNTNRVHIMCSNLVIHAGGVINANGLGHPGGDKFGHEPGYGPGRGIATLSGAGYGGLGGRSGGIVYGSSTTPELPGSGGAGSTTYNGFGGAGGGAVRIDASGHVLLNGIITANGGPWSGSYGGGGAGGGIYITCRTFGGTNGLVRANGSNGATGNCGGGGGGRIAISIADLTAQNALPRPSVYFSTYRGTAGGGDGQLGTVNLATRRLVVDTLTSNSNGKYEGFSTWDVDTLTVNNGWVGLMVTGALVTVTNDLTVLGSSGRLDLIDATVQVGGSIVLNAGDLYLYGGSTNCPTIACAGDLILTNSSVFHVYGGETNASPDYGARVSVTGNIFVGSGCTISPHSHPINGGSVLFVMDTFSLASNAQVNASGFGFASGPSAGQVDGYGPGKGEAWRGGGGHGGVGVQNSAGYGETYGSSNAPIHAGSGGASYSISNGGEGGSVVRMIIADTATIAGSILANGGNLTGSYGGGGAGGSIYLQADTFAPATGILNARGGNGSSGGNGGGGGGGGGGRIALRYRINNLVATTSVLGGIGGIGGVNVGGTGTVYLALLPGYMMLQVSGDPEQHGTSSPYNYGDNGVLLDEWVTNSAITPTEEANGQRYVCVGWDITNAAGSSSSDTNNETVFQMTTNTDLTWYWKRQCYLDTAACSNGSLQVDMTGWYMSTSQVSVTAAPDGGYSFLQWTGTGVPPGQNTNNPIILTMERPRTIKAKFANATPTTRYWNGTGDWFSETNWSSSLGSGIPGTGDVAIIQSGVCMPSEPIVANELVISNNATLCFTNWRAIVTAVDIVVQTNGTITHAGPFLNTDMSNRVVLACEDLTVDVGGEINVKALGYRGGITGAHTGHGPGGGGGISGGGHGGRGGGNVAGGTYDSLMAPTVPGSGGGGYASGVGKGGHGGGTVSIDASDLVVINGVITADGGNYLQTYGGGGAGGTISITCGRFAGTNGTIRASGGSGNAGAGGGRIAIVITNTVAQDALPHPTVIFSTDRGTGSYGDGHLGTIYMSTNLLTNVLTADWSGRYWGIGEWNVDSLTINGGRIGLMTDGVGTTVTNNLTIDGDGYLNMTNGNLSVGGSILLNAGGLSLYADGTTNCPSLTCGNMLLTNSAVFRIYSGMTNAATADHGASVSISGTMSLTTGSVAYAYSHPFNGGSPLFTMGNLYVAFGAQISANGRGFSGAIGPGISSPGYGPGRGEGYPGGGGYGGAGAQNSPGYGETYGSSNAPIHAGSGGGTYTGSRGGYGGGAIRMEISNKATIEGAISANGGNWFQSYGGGGSGGSIYLQLNRIIGSLGTLTASGGNGSTSGGSGGGGGGGGGRIAVVYRRGQFSGTTSVVGGIGGVGGVNVGDPGTVVWIQLAPNGTIFLFR